MRTRVLVDQGVCECVRAPYGANGLEGYAEHSVYPYQAMQDDRGLYYRVYPSSLFPDYYETCGALVFGRYFNTKIDANWNLTEKAA